MILDILEKVMGFILFVSFVIIVIYCFYVEREKECVEFYKENHYVLDFCDKYKDKLEKGD